MNIKLTALLMLLFFGTVRTIGQSDNVAIAVAVPVDCTLDAGTMSILKNKLMRIANADGVATTECGAIAVIPDIDVLNKEQIDGGMRKITSVEVGLTLTVRNIMTNSVFGTFQMNCNGEGYSEAEAMRSAINKIDATSAQFQGFLSASRKKITEYYSANTNALITKAKTLATQQSYDEALALLATYPESLSGYPSVASAMADIFKQCQTQYCSQILMAAQAAYSRHDYAESADMLAMIDATSSCASQATSLLASVNKALNKQYADQLAIEKEKLRSKERVKTAQINAVKEIATAYFKRQNNYLFFW